MTVTIGNGNSSQTPDCSVHEGEYPALTQRMRRIALVWILLASGISIWWGFSVGQTAKWVGGFQGSLLRHAMPA